MSRWMFPGTWGVKQIMTKELINRESENTQTESRGILRFMNGDRGSAVFIWLKS